MSGPRTKFYVGFDVASASDGDYSALCVIEPHQDPPKEQWRPPTRWYGAKPIPPPECQLPPIQFWLRHLERLKRGMPYPQQVSYILSRLRSPALLGQNELVVDATGVGRPVVDLFRQAKVARLTPITITGGLKANHDEEGWKVPKRDLVISTQILLQQGRLRIADRLPLKDVFRQELLAFKVKVDPLTANDSYAAGTSGAHDDLVLSVALACWRAQQLSGALGMPIGGFKRSERRFSADPKTDKDWGPEK